MIGARFANNIRPDRATSGYLVAVTCGRSGCAGRLGTVWLPPVAVTSLPAQWLTAGAWLNDLDRKPPVWRRRRRRHGQTAQDESSPVGFPDRVPLPAAVECPACLGVETIALPKHNPSA